MTNTRKIDPAKDLPFITLNDLGDDYDHFIRIALRRWVPELDGADEERIDNLVDGIREAVLDDLKDRSRERCEDEFLAGWEEAGGYVADLEAGSPTPWCCPWTYQGWVWSSEIEGRSPRERGAAYWAEVKDEVLEEVRASEEAKALEEEEDAS